MIIDIHDTRSLEGDKRVKISWRVYFGALLVAISALLYLAHYYEFRDLHHLAIYGLGDLAFLPIEVLLVVLVVDWAINEQEKRSQLTKLNMVIGIYFSEVGTALLKAFSDFDPNIESIRDELLVKGQMDHSRLQRGEGTSEKAQI